MDHQQATTHFDYLKVNGHQIWISDLTFTLDIKAPTLEIGGFQQMKSCINHTAPKILKLLWLLLSSV